MGKSELTINPLVISKYLLNGSDTDQTHHLLNTTVVTLYYRTNLYDVTIDKPFTYNVHVFKIQYF